MKSYFFAGIGEKNKQEIFKTLMERLLPAGTPDYFELITGRWYPGALTSRQ